MSKTIVPPTRQKMDMKTREIRLWFDKDRSIVPDGRYRMLGGMWLPSNIKTADGFQKIYGYAMMAGRNEDTKVVYIFDEVVWVTVDHVLDPSDGSVLAEGIVTWLNRIWANFFASTFAQRQDDETLFRYQIDFSRCAMVQPKPSFLDAEWNDPSQPAGVINRELLLGRLKMKRDSVLIQELDQFRADPDAEANDYPAVHSLKCCMATLDRYWA